MKIVKEMKRMMPETLNKVFLRKAEAETQNTRIKKRKIVLISKKSNKRNCSQVRPISVISSFYKILSKIINRRLIDALEDIIPKNVLAYTKNNSPDRTVKYINDIKDIIIEKEEKAFAIQLDFKSAYDVLNRKFIYALLETMNVPETIIKKLKNLLEDNEGILTVNKNIIGSIELNAGVGQGDANSCLLYNIATIPIAMALEKSPLIKDIKIKLNEN